jgi:hypothetical protein
MRCSQRPGRAQLRPVAILELGLLSETALQIGVLVSRQLSIQVQPPSSLRQIEGDPDGLDGLRRWLD